MGIEISPLVHVRYDDNPTKSLRPAEVCAGTFEHSRPWRTFRSRRGQRHYSGLYWSARMRGHVLYESRLELARLLFADRDATVQRIYAQPFLLSTTASGQARRHVPDFVLVHGDGSISVVDVKPRIQLGRTKVADTLAWAEWVVTDRGWRFEVWSEPDPQLLANVRFLAAYRRPELFDAGLLAEIKQAIAEPTSIRAVEMALSGRWPGLTVRPHLLHLLWRNEITADLGSSLNGMTLIEKVSA